MFFKNLKMMCNKMDEAINNKIEDQTPSTNNVKYGS